MLITAGRVLVGSGTYLDDGAVLVEGDSITAVGPRVEIAERTGSDVMRLAFPEGTVVPGLIDAHVHLAFDGGADPVAALHESNDETLLTNMRHRAEQLLRSGVTTVRDLGDRNGLALRLDAEIAGGSTLGPRIVSAGTPATPPGGHCYFLGGEVSGAAEVRGLVRRNIAAGAGVIKAMVTGGGLTKDGPKSWQSQFTPEELHALVDEAHQAGVPVAAHAHGTEGIAAAVEAGVDTIEHCTWMTSNGFDLRQDVLKRIIDDGIAVCPAVSPPLADAPRFFGEERAAAMFDLVRQMAEAGVRLIAGTDAGVQRAGVRRPGARPVVLRAPGPAEQQDPRSCDRRCSRRAGTGRDDRANRSRVPGRPAGDRRRPPRRPHRVAGGPDGGDRRAAARAARDGRTAVGARMSGARALQSPGQGATRSPPVLSAPSP
ncbi:hypothetical protein GCM10020295_37280 [Streptomyces cinereospinus]